MSPSNTSYNYSSSCTALIQPPEFRGEDINVMCMLSVFSIVGVFGNGLVIYVYSKKRDKLTSNIFILALALTDFTTSILIMPYTVLLVYVQEELMYDFACKIYILLITLSVPLSAFIMSAIAVDRYACICHPFCHLLTVPRAKFILVIELTFSTFLGIITSLMYSVYQLPSEFLSMHLVDGYNVSDHFYNCKQIYTGYCYPTSILLNAEFIYYYQKVFSSFFLISLLIVFTLYILVFRYVTSRRAKRLKRESDKRYSTTMTQTEASHLDSNDSHQSNRKSTKVEIKDNVLTTELLPLNIDCSNELKQKNLKTLSERIFLANTKTACMLFVVAVVFIVAFLPAWLMALSAIPYEKVVFYSYFVYNVVNPIIYAFMNPAFRTDLKKVYNSCVSRK